MSVVELATVRVPFGESGCRISIHAIGYSPLQYDLGCVYGSHEQGPVLLSAQTRPFRHPDYADSAIKPAPGVTRRVP